MPVVGNKLIDLNNNLFEAMENLLDADLSTEQGRAEIGRAKAVASIGKIVVDNARLALDAQKLYEACEITEKPLMMIEEETDAKTTD